MLSRLRDSLEAAVTSLLLVRRGRKDCPELSRLLEERRVKELTPATRRLVRRHLDACPRCQESKKRYLSPVEIFGAFVPVAAPAGLRQEIWLRVSHQIGGAAPGALAEEAPAAQRILGSIRELWRR